MSSMHSGVLVRYSGEVYLDCISNRNKIVAEYEDGLITILKQNLSKIEPIYFMPVDVEDAIEYVKGVPVYIMRLYGPLINGQKADRKSTRLNSSHVSES